MTALAPSTPLAPAPASSRAAWLLEVEARALLTRLDRVKPFVLAETMVPVAALMPAAQVAIDRYLMHGRRELRARVVRYLGWLAGPGRAAPAPELQRRFTVLKLQFNIALSQLDLFAEAISQRSEHETGVWLAGLDAAAEDALALPDAPYRAPPVVCHLSRGIGGAIRRARTRLPGGGATPVAIIRIPRERMIGHGIASSLVHEVGHQGAALLGLVESARAAWWREGSARKSARALLGRWLSEIVADFWAVARIGISSTLGLIGIVSLPRRYVFRIDPDDPHPFPWIRVHLSCAIGDALYPHPQWRRLADTWNTLYPPQGLAPEPARIIGALLEALPALASFLVAHRPPSLRGRSVGELLRSPEREPERLTALRRTWRERPTLMYTAPPTLAFAVIGRGRAAGLLSPEEESRMLGRLIAHWALHSTLDLLGTCSVAWAARGGPCPAPAPVPEPSPGREMEEVP